MRRNSCCWVVYKEGEHRVFTKSEGISCVLEASTVPYLRYPGKTRYYIVEYYVT